mmetsp:Transcript_5626/g.16182  ORF Transcript_5626/g.16182 Transcript_5626/m.16182 type:complete len:265 (-) Transcript_5626:1182-1976(-)
MAPHRDHHGPLPAVVRRSMVLLRRLGEGVPLLRPDDLVRLEPRSELDMQQGDSLELEVAARGGRRSHHGDDQRQHILLPQRRPRRLGHAAAAGDVTARVDDVGGVEGCLPHRASGPRCLSRVRDADHQGGVLLQAGRADEAFQRAGGRGACDQLVLGPAVPRGLCNGVPPQRRLRRLGDSHIRRVVCGAAPLGRQLRERRRGGVPGGLRELQRHARVLRRRLRAQHGSAARLLLRLPARPVPGLVGEDNLAERHRHDPELHNIR